jgi:hypothetical protein
MRIRKDKIVHPPVSWAVKGSDGVAVGASSSMLKTASFTCANISVVLYSHTLALYNQPLPPSHIALCTEWPERFTLFESGCYIFAA